MYMHNWLKIVKPFVHNTESINNIIKSAISHSHPDAHKCKAGWFCAPQCDVCKIVQSPNTLSGSDEVDSQEAQHSFLIVHISVCRRSPECAGTLTLTGAYWVSPHLST